ncbi:MAG: protoporphyrinogen oxidase [Deltaproteobacteria bacterium]|nr:protoporphyrinogen oxidase [Deltaproteobacteria bacterium]
MRVAIVGGGISGLATAAALEVRGAETIVLEADAHPGGKVRTERVDGYLCEYGPNGFLDREPATRALCDRLKISDRIVAASAAARSRFIMKGGKLHAVPASPGAFFTSRLLSPSGRLRVASEPLRRARRDHGDETVADFGRRRIGEEAVEVLLDPMVSGIFAGDVHRLSVGSAFPRIVELERRYGSLVRAMVSLGLERRRTDSPRGDGGGPAGPGGELCSFVSGMQEAIDTLAARLEGRIRTGARAVAIERRDGSRWLVHVDGAQPVEADRLVLALPAPATAKLVGALDPSLGSLVGGIPYANIVVVLLGVERRHVGKLDGFGVLIPRREGKRCLGMIWTSTVFPNRAPEGKVLVDARIGGALDPGAVDLDDEALEALVRRELGASIGLDGPTVFRRIYRHPSGIPQYVVGHRDRLAQIDRFLHHLPGLYLTGNAYRGVGFNDCIREANVVADAVGGSTC